MKKNKSKSDKKDKEDKIRDLKLPLKRTGDDKIILENNVELKEVIEEKPEEENNIKNEEEENNIKNEEDNINEENEDRKNGNKNENEEDKINEDIKNENDKEDRNEEQNEMKIDLNEHGNGSINLNISNSGISSSHNWKCHCVYECCLYCENRNSGCCICLNKPVKCSSCSRIMNKQKGIISLSSLIQKRRYVVMPPEQKKKVNFTGIEMTEYRNSVSQSTNNISAPLITPRDSEIPLPLFNNLENIELNENRL